MRNFFAKVILLTTTMFLIPVTTVSAKVEKVTVCHNGQSISISSSALHAHLNQNDTVGPCSPTSVPEFGFATGAIAIFGSGVAYLALRKNYVKAKLA